MLRPSNKHRRVQKLSEGGYISQIGKTSPSGGVLPSIGTALDQVIPALTLTYKPIERALPPDLASVPLALKAESAKTAAEKQKAGQDLFTKAVADKGYMPWQQAKLENDMKAIRDEIKQNLTVDPNYYSSSLNAQNLESTLSGVVSSERMSIFQNQLKEVADVKAHIEKEKIGENTYLDKEGKEHIDPKTNKPLSYNDYLNYITNSSASDPYVQDLLQTSKRPEGYVSFTKKAGQTPEDVRNPIAAIVAAVKPDTVSRASEIPGMSFDTANAQNAWASFTSTKKSWSSTYEKMKSLNANLKENWKDLLGPRGQYAIEEEGRKNFYNKSYQYKGKDVSATDLMQGDADMKAYGKQLMDNEAKSVVDKIIDTQTKVGGFKTDTKETTKTHERMQAAPQVESSSGSAQDASSTLEPPGVLPEQSMLATERDDWGLPWTGGTVNIPIVANSTQQPSGKEVRSNLTIKATKGYVLSTSGLFTGAPRTSKVQLDYDLVNATHQRNIVSPVYTGQVIDKAGNPKEVKGLQNSLVSEGTKDKAEGAPEAFAGGGNPKVEYDQKYGYHYVEGKDHQRYRVKLQSFEVWTGKKDQLGGENVTIMKPDNYRESQYKYGGRNYTDARPNEFVTQTQHYDEKTKKNYWHYTPNAEFNKIMPQYVQAVTLQKDNQLEALKTKVAAGQAEANGDEYKRIMSAYARVAGGKAWEYDPSNPKAKNGWVDKTYPNPAQKLKEIRYRPLEAEIFNDELANFASVYNYEKQMATMPKTEDVTKAKATEQSSLTSAE